jgi:hypothetical protein
MHVLSGVLDLGVLGVASAWKFKLNVFWSDEFRGLV